MQISNELFKVLGAVPVVLMRHGAPLPEHTIAAIQAATEDPSPRNRIVAIGEALYAAKDTLNNELRELAAQCFDLMREHSWLHVSVEDANRAAAVIRALQRDSGETAPAGKPWPKEADDPAPVAAYGAPEADGAPEAPDAPAVPA